VNCSFRRCRPQPVLLAGLRSDITLNTRFLTSPSRTYKIGTAQHLECVATFQASVQVGTQINRGTVMEVRFLQTPDCQVTNDRGPRMLNLYLVTHNRFAPAFNGAVIVPAVPSRHRPSALSARGAATCYLQVFRSSWSI
jgi:hypothetical protein